LQRRLDWMADGVQRVDATNIEVPWKTH
jgi:hypothetical protein